ncbi:MAG: hypothetical protein PHY45_05710 [Rhodocyclaceae bacterium]|nr:hypothetical protein [Rhodocyclaceae bacterium]
MRNKPLALLLALSCLAVDAACHADDYQLGQGVDLGNNFILSGYGSLVLDAPRPGPSAVSIDDLSLFVTGRVNQWVNPFAEIELSGVTLLQQGNAPHANGYLLAERLYNDAQVGEADTFRVGKMLSPVGDWNLIHAAPLVPTTTRPLTTYRGFSEYASGMAWLHQDSQGNMRDWQFYWQPAGEWFQRPDAIAARHYRDVWGGHVSWPMGLTDKVGISFQRGRLTATDGSYTLVGANGRKTFGALMLESEAIASKRLGNTALAHSHEWGLYGLADYSFTPRWHGLFEWEDYQDHLVDRHSRNTLLGVAYKPESSLVWKLEYVHQYGVSRDIPTGWTASISILF